MRLVLAHSHARTFGGGERAVLELARQFSAQHRVELLLGGFDARHTYPELGSFPGRRVGRWEWPVLRVAADAFVFVDSALTTVGDRPEEQEIVRRRGHKLGKLFRAAVAIDETPDAAKVVVQVIRTL